MYVCIVRMSFPNPNTIPISPQAISTMCAYPLGTVRKDMSIQEYINYKYDWNLFTTAWTYNYTVSTLNGSVPGLGLSFYKFTKYSDTSAYLNGQSAHVAYYSNVPGQFNNID